MWWEHGVLWLSLNTRSYHPSLLVGSLDCIQCPDKASVCPCWPANLNTFMRRRTLLHQQYPAWLVYLTWIVNEMGEGKWLLLCVSAVSRYFFQNRKYIVALNLDVRKFHPLILRGASFMKHSENIDIFSSDIKTVNENVFNLRFNML